MADARASRDEEIQRIRGEVIHAQEIFGKEKTAIIADYDAKLAKCLAVENELKNGTFRLREENEELRSAVMKSEAATAEAELSAQRVASQFESMLSTLRQVEDRYESLVSDSAAAERLKSKRILELEKEVENIRISRAKTTEDATRAIAIAAEQAQQAILAAQEAKAQHRQSEIAASDAVNMLTKVRRELDDMTKRCLTAETELLRWREAAASAAGELERQRGATSAAESLLEATKLALETARTENHALRQSVAAKSKTKALRGSAAVRTSQKEEDPSRHDGHLAEDGNDGGTTAATVGAIMMNLSPSLKEMVTAKDHSDDYEEGEEQEEEEDDGLDQHTAVKVHGNGKRKIPVLPLQDLHGRVVSTSAESIDKMRPLGSLSSSSSFNENSNQIRRAGAATTILYVDENGGDDEIISGHAASTTPQLITSSVVAAAVLRDENIMHTDATVSNRPESAPLHLRVDVPTFDDHHQDGRYTTNVLGIEQLESPLLSVRSINHPVPLYTRTVVSDLPSARIDGNKENKARYHCQGWTEEGLQEGPRPLRDITVDIAFEGEELYAAGIGDSNASGDAVGVPSMLNEASELLGDTAAGKNGCMVKNRDGDEDGGAVAENGFEKKEERSDRALSDENARLKEQLAAMKLSLVTATSQRTMGSIKGNGVLEGKGEEIRAVQHLRRPVYGMDPDEALENAKRQVAIAKEYLRQLVLE